MGMVNRIADSRRLSSFIEFSHYIFSYSLVTYVLVLVVESVWDGGISSIVDPGYLLVLVLGAGIVSLWARGLEEPKKPESLRWRYYVLIAAVGVAVGGTVWFGTQGLGAQSLVLSGAVGVFAASFLILLFREGE